MAFHNRRDATGGLYSKPETAEQDAAPVAQRACNGTVLLLLRLDMILRSLKRLRMNRERMSGSIFPKRVLQYANIWERAAAFLIDGLIVLLISMIISSQIAFPYNWILTAWLYDAFQVSGYYQATIGQRTMGIKVSNVYGGRLDFAAASLRHFCKYISLFTALSGYLIIILDKKRQCLHDKIAQANVVTADSYQAAV